MEEELGSIDDTMQETLAAIENAESGTDANTSDTSTDTTDSAPAQNRQGASAPAPAPFSSGTGGAVGAATSPAAEPWREMPRSWKQEMRDYWQKQDPAVMQYVHQREQEALRGITQYKQVADQWGAVLKPYEAQIKQYGLNPYKAVSDLVAIHTVLRLGTDEQKAQVAQILDKDYGLARFFGAPGQQQANRGPDLSAFNNRILSVEQQLQQRALGEASSEVDKFLADPTNEFASEAAPRMLELLETNRARDLKEAYDIAVKTDPVLFEKYVSKRIQAATRPPNRAPTNTRPSRVPPSTAGRTRGTIEDTMRETLSNIQSR